MSLADRADRAVPDAMLDTVGAGSRSVRTATLSLLLLFTLLALWEGLVRFFDVPRIVLPAPSAVALALWAAVLDPAFAEHFLRWAPRPAWCWAC